MIAIVRSARQYAEQPALRELIEIETYPGPDCRSEDEMIAAYDSGGSCGYHAVGSCRMGRDERSVVDPELRVRGVEGLRVMDTSVMPQIPAGNTNGPTMAMTWRSADIIRRAACDHERERHHRTPPHRRCRWPVLAGASRGPARIAAL